MEDPVPGLVLLDLLLRSTRNTLRHGTVVWRIVVYPTEPLRMAQILDTVWDLLQEGP